MILKREVNIEDFMTLHPNLFLIIGYVASFAYENKLEFKITSLKTDIVESRMFSTHRDGRAFDVSIKNWPEQKINEIVTKANGEFYDIAALSASDNTPRACVRHGEGENNHLHFQVRQ